MSKPMPTLTAMQLADMVSGVPVRDATGDTVTVYERKDGRWDWRRQAANGDIIDGSEQQGYEAFARAWGMAVNLNRDLRASAFRVQGLEGEQ